MRLFTSSIIFICFLISCSDGSYKTVKGDDRISMPEFSGDYKKVARGYYKIAFTEDGYPAKLQEDGSLYDHPIYGAYVINHYLARYNRGEDSLKSYIELVAKATMKRMKEENGALWMKYPEGSTRAEVSGLTQSRYLIQFASLYDTFKDSVYVDVANKLFNSFTVPIEKGGFYNEFSRGVSIEEYPEQPISYVLNGWLTALWNLHEYRRMIDNPRADSLFLRSSNTLANLLPLYDYPEQYNSLYQLAGYQFLKLVFEHSNSIEIVNAKVTLPGVQSYEINSLGEEYKNRYAPNFFKSDIEIKDGKRFVDDDILHMNVITNRMVEPDQILVELTLDSEKETEATLFYGTGIQDPQMSLPAYLGYDEDSTFTVSTGLSTVRLPLKNEKIAISYIPTKFSKEIEGKSYNAYHFIHIDKLRKLYDITGNEAFRTWADKWEGYIDHWSELEILKDPKISIEPI